jgi:hypothetical protein
MGGVGLKGELYTSHTCHNYQERIMLTSQYRSFLLRLWQVTEKGEQEWRASLENVESGEKHGFSSLEELWSYLCQVTTNKDEIPGEGS